MTRICPVLSQLSVTVLFAPLGISGRKFDPKLAEKVSIWKSNFIKHLPDGSAIVIDPSQGNKAVSEGLGYGLLISVESGDEELFGKLLKSYERISKTRPDNLSPWLLDEVGNIKDRANAIDADIDTALALIKAYQKWGKAEYKEKALKIIQSIGDKTLKTASGKTYLLPSADAIKFIKGADYVLNPSYFNIEAFREFAKLDKSHDWLAVVDSSYEIIGKCMKKFGFVPDWVGLKSETGNVFKLTKDYRRSNYLFSENQRVHIFGNDAIRILLHLSRDFNQTKDPRALATLQAILDKTTTQAAEVADAWSDSAYHNETAVSLFALAANSIGHKDTPAFIDEFDRFKTQQYYGQWKGAKQYYYNQSIALLAEIEMSK